MPGLNEMLAKASQKLVTEGAAKVTEPFFAAMFVGTAAAALGPALVAIAFKEAIGFVVGPLFMQMFDVTDQLGQRVKDVENRLAKVEKNLADRPLHAQDLLVLKIAEFAHISFRTRPDEILYMRDQVALAAMQVELETRNAKDLSELNRFRSDLLLGIAASIQPGDRPPRGATFNGVSLG